ncbi:hypothetical protein [Methanosarcina horonobensis]|uniref:hypothetical protein n=1 Tax=Methanosarcina horonobensis TaxID=418008 RepID=UPI0022B85AEA|nr:hypothetical protein [Methanosarcina horonobensis]
MLRFLAIKRQHPLQGFFSGRGNICELRVQKHGGSLGNKAGCESSSLHSLFDPKRVGLTTKCCSTRQVGDNRPQLLDICGDLIIRSLTVLEGTLTVLVFGRTVKADKGSYLFFLEKCDDLLIQQRTVSCDAEEDLLPFSHSLSFGERHDFSHQGKVHQGSPPKKN